MEKMSPWAKDDDIGAFLPSQERISSMCKEFQKGWSEQERYDRIYNPKIVDIGRGRRKEGYNQSPPFSDPLEDDPDYSWLEDV